MKRTKPSELETGEKEHSKAIAVGPSFWENMTCEVSQDRPLHAEMSILESADFPLHAGGNENNGARDIVFSFFVSEMILRNHVKLVQLLAEYPVQKQIPPQPISFLLCYILHSNWHKANRKITANAPVRPL